METKIFEIRDAATHISALAVKLSTKDEKEAYSLEWAGFSKDCNVVVLVKLETSEANSDPFNWANRTMRAAHSYISENFDLLKTGDVVDVRYILGETDEPCKSDANWRF